MFWDVLVEIDFSIHAVGRTIYHFRLHQCVVFVWNNRTVLECVPKPSQHDEVVINFPSNKWAIILNPLHQPYCLTLLHHLLNSSWSLKIYVWRSEVIYIDDIIVLSTARLSTRNKLSCLSPTSFVFLTLWIFPFLETVGGVIRNVIRDSCRCVSSKLACLSCIASRFACYSWTENNQLTFALFQLLFLFQFWM